MSTHNLLSEIQGMIRSAALTKTATATLTDAEVMENFVIYGNHASSGIVLTLPIATEANKGALCLIVNQGVAAVTIEADATVAAALGFGGVGSGGDIVTLSQGLGAMVMSNGTYWYVFDMASIA